MYYILLQWRHNEHDGISTHRRLHCLLNCLFRCRSKKYQSSMSLASVRGIQRWPVNSSHKRPVTRKMFSFDDIIMKYPPGKLALSITVKAGPFPHGCRTYKCTIIWGFYHLPVLTKHMRPCHLCFVITMQKIILTHWGRDKMAAIFQTTLSNAFSWMKMYKFRLRFHWSLFPRVQLAIYQYWFR